MAMVCTRPCAATSATDRVRRHRPDLDEPLVRQSLRDQADRQRRVLPIVRVDSGTSVLFCNVPQTPASREAMFFPRNIVVVGAALALC